MQTLLDDLDIIELYQQPGKAHHLSEITKKQMALYDAMGVATRNRYNFTGLQALRTLGPKGRQPSPLKGKRLTDLCVALLLHIMFAVHAKGVSILSATIMV